MTKAEIKTALQGMFIDVGDFVVIDNGSGDIGLSTVLYGIPVVEDLGNNTAIKKVIQVYSYLDGTASEQAFMSNNTRVKLTETAEDLLKEFIKPYRGIIEHADYIEKWAIVKATIPNPSDANQYVEQRYLVTHNGTAFGYKEIV